MLPQHQLQFRVRPKTKLAQVGDDWQGSSFGSNNLFEGLAELLISGSQSRCAILLGMWVTFLPSAGPHSWIWLCYSLGLMGY